MKKKIAILGSTGSIGKTLLNIISKDYNNFEIVLLSANTNYKELFKQTKKFNVKNVIINNKESLIKFKNKNKNKNKKSKLKIYNNYESMKYIFKKKIDYVMSSIVGLDGLEPTLKIIKHTKKIAIANKESIICAWNLIKKELDKNKTEFIPVDSEHFSLWFGMLDLNKNIVDKVFLTASGGPFYKKKIGSFKNITIKEAVNHPNWKMGKKISIDSATMINKVFEVIEAKNIFNIPYNKIDILIHPKSYIHAILKLNNGMTKIIAHDTTMKIPIFNSIYSYNKNIDSKNLDINKLNNLNLKKVDQVKYPMLKILKKLPKKNSLYETIIVSANDELVSKFLNKKIRFTDISKNLLKILNYKKFIKYKSKSPKNIGDIRKLVNYVRLKISLISV